MKQAICALFFMICALVIFAKIFCPDWFEDDDNDEYK